PASIGRLQVLGALRDSPDFRVLLAYDPALNRRVWITMHVGAARPDEVRQREITRLSRLRWVGGGTENDWHWDAWLAPLGVPLRQLVQQQRLAWHDAAAILENLAHELVISVEEGLLPEQLHLDQVWVGAEGKVQLLSFCWSDGPGDEGTAVAAHDKSQPSPDDRAVDLLRRVAVILLEGQPREGGEARVRAPLPRSVAAALSRLFPGPNRWSTPKEFRDELRRLAGQPDEVTRGRRFGQIVVMLLGALPFSLCLLAQPFLGELCQDLFRWQELETQAQRMQRVAAADLALGMLNPDPQVRLTAVLRWPAEQQKIDAAQREVEHAKALRDIRLRTMFPPLRRALEHQVTEQKGGEGSISVGAEFHESNSPPLTPAAQARKRIWLLLLLAGVWSLSTAIFHGGWSFRVVGVQVVREDGRPVDVVRGAARGLLFWAPILTLWFLAELFGHWYWRDWLDVEHRRSAMWLLWASVYLWRAGAVLLLAYLVAALWQPQRAPHDRILGTYIVPR
ncbi:MAG: RDD family protein, partial [Gemmataceae bacterium]|nr:RDD family protein [Gemmataceae bacterium]